MNTVIRSEYKPVLHLWLIFLIALEQCIFKVHRECGSTGFCYSSMLPAALAGSVSEDPATVALGVPAGFRVPFAPKNNHVTGGFTFIKEIKFSDHCML